MYLSYIRRVENAKDGLSLAKLASKLHFGYGSSPHWLSARELHGTADVIVYLVRDTTLNHTSWGTVFCETCADAQKIRLRDVFLALLQSKLRRQ